MNSSLSQIAKTLFSDSLLPDELEATLKSYKSLLLNSTELDLNDQCNKVDIELQNGIAIGLSWAASCLDDSIRTLKFLRGTKQAIETKLKESASVHLLYAGTGPFATLILPLLSHFSSNQLQVTLLDVNPTSVENVTQLIDRFNFKNHVQEIRCADATKTTFEKASEFDILLSETMQHALQSELQVVITSHLLNQMEADTILIPQSIELGIVSANSDSMKVQHVDHFLKVDAHFLRSHRDIQAGWYIEQRIDSKKLQFRANELLAISTKIQVHENEQIEWNESGLTTLKIIGVPEDFQNTNEVAIRYVISPEPGCVIYTDRLQIT
ncbi:MAG: hypothetical protein AB8B56_05945 [Crocinitomicaceae bacterium]